MRIQTLRALIVGTLALAASGQAPAQEGLYLVSGFPTPNRPFGVPTKIFALTGKPSSPLVGLCDAEKGCDGVLIDYDRRLLVVTSPSITPKRVDVVSFDAPNRSRSAALTYDSAMSVIAANLLDTGKSVQLALTLGDARTQALAGFDLTTLAAVPMTWQDLGGARVAGTFGVGQTWSDAVELLVHDGGSLAPRVAKATAGDFAMKLPAGFTPPSDAIVYLQVNDAHVAVVSSSREQTPNDSGVGFRIDHVYVKATRTWQTVKVPGAASWARGLGNWLAYVVAEPFHGVESPGKQARMAHGLAVGHSVDEIFEDADAYFPGTLFLYNTLSGSSVRVETGQGDSEPLWVSGDQLYYRVNQSIYVATIAGSSVKDAAVVASGDGFGQVHWAFPGAKPEL
jgi:hypothetical protein